MRDRRLVALLALVLFGSLAHAVPATAAPQGKLVFAANRGTSFNIWVASADGSLTNQVTQTPDVDELDPTWSPDGSKIAFARKPDWRGESDIWVMNEDGSGLQPLTDEFGFLDDRQPAWSPDGSRLAWVRSMPNQGTSEIWTMKADGSGAMPLVQPDPGRFAGSPDWAPNGQRVAFVANPLGGFPDVWTVLADGTGLQRLTSTTQMEGNPTWSPDGSLIAFERRTTTGTAQIWTIAPTGGNPQSLTSGTAVKEQPAWAPDGAAIAYVRSPQGGGVKDLEITSVDGTEVTSVTGTERAEIAPDWAEGSVAESVASLEPAPTTSAEEGSSRELLATTSTSVGPGLHLLEGRFQLSDYWALRFNPEKLSTLDVALATDVLPGLETVSSMATRHGAIAAINGDFFLPSGAPIHPFAEDGDLKKTGFGSHNFAPSIDEDALYLDRPIDSISVTEFDVGDSWTVDRWNDGAPTFGEVAAYSPAGATDAPPPSFACSVRLVKPSAMRLAPSSEGIVRDYSVNAVACNGEALSRAGGVVLAARPGTVGALMIASLMVGEEVSLTWWFHGWTEVADSVGGWPSLLHQGEVKVEPCSESICLRHPRAGVGITGTGKVLLVVVDGRREGSAGLTLVQFAHLFRQLEATSALNLDGGGSAEMWVRGDVVNNPSDGQERPIGTAILVLPGGDSGQAILPSASVSAMVPRAEATAARASLLDPASTGGLLDGIARGLFGPRQPLPSDLRDELREFRSQH